MAGGVAGLGAAVKKGFQAGKSTVAGAGDEPASSGGSAPTASGGTGSPTSAATTSTASGGAQTQTLANPKDPNTGAAPAAAGGSLKSNTPFGRLTQAAAGQDPDAPEQPATQEKPAAGGAAQPAAEKPAADADQEKPAAAGTPQTGTMKGAPNKPGFTGVPERPGAADSQGRKEPTMGAAAPANDSEFKKVQQNIGKLPPEQQKELMAALMSDPEVKKALEQPAAAPAETPAAGQDQSQAVTTPQATDAKPGRQRDAKGRFIGKGAPRPAPAASQTEIDADRERFAAGMGSESVNRSKKSLSEISSDTDKTIKAVHTGLQAGLSNPFSSKPNYDTDQEADSATAIVDKSGTVPVELIKKVNQLDSVERKELLKRLKANFI